MAQGNFIPQRGKTYTADDYSWLGELFTIGATVYKFVKFASGLFIRKYSLLKVDNASCATQLEGISFGKCGGVMDFDIDTVSGAAALYGLVVVYGDANVDAGPRANTCVFVDASLIAYTNGQSRCSNANVNVAITGYTAMQATTQSLVLTAAAEMNYAMHVSTGDLIAINVVPNYTMFVGTIINGSSVATTAHAGTPVAAGTSYAVRVVRACGSLDQFGKKAAYTCGAYYGRYINATGWSAIQPTAPSVNVCGASTILFVNSCAVGTMFKVGDNVKLAGTATATGTCTFVITSLQNAYAFTVNAAPAADAAGMMGVFANVNAFYNTVRIDGNS